MKFEIGDILKRNDLYKATFPDKEFIHHDLFEVLGLLGDGDLRVRCFYSRKVGRAGTRFIVHSSWVTVVEQM